ncbi:MULTISPECIES: bifunctional 2-polyprenyl-6-hydroxyphenol methylase/3-demethylubiquinol 3-O-methyltransferase UbiG [Okeania]|uniref:class I SAM-dependent methyltransferase n=1 Tax=Okeania TaxID=1458928 RepID=UPI000F535454|nr:MULTISPECIES: class I SAM-dependent methyltransferase [Okeania]NES75843.1 class I SAM-dependent methyltransferase [Okeania sp. SIO1H4]NES88125.1 class I SAM-dependent methyltransferase [Okeania sp. SIO2B9]NET20028.1 class I SAM-dependent methyltransferase [Okeania sp. SIO1H5]NET75537.1 class I SAM-dependent methyltransferase [Okeania sp. SIO1F9]NET91862.1 class I SAM-dependent methyltransferase [Okeania sp. SIO1H2]
MKDKLDISSAVEGLYDTFPFPPDPLVDEAPPGYNWRWSWPVAYSFCTGQIPQKQDIRILDAGCGTGSSTDYLVHLNPQASVVGIDLSSGALQVAKERCSRSGASRVEFHHLSIYDVGQIEGEFDFINCVGVLHHLPDPIKGIQNLTLKLAPGGIMHIFVYAELGRWEIRLMQQAIAILQGNQPRNYKDGVKIGRQLFASLPENNRLVKYEQERWAFENKRDECFADMYVHPQEIDYNIDTLFELIEASGLKFLGFSNREYWNIERLIGKSSELVERVVDLDDRERYRLIELLDPQISHYEFFLGRPPLPKIDWSDDRLLLAAIPELSPCIQGWPSENIFDGEYKLVNLSRKEYEFLQACDTNSNSQSPSTVGEILANIPVELEIVRSLQSRLLILLTE